MPSDDSFVINGMGQFIVGFIVGQAALGVLVFLVVKVFLFKNGQEVKAELKKSKYRKLLEPKGPIHIVEFSLGDEFPTIISSLMRFSEQTADLRAEVTFDFSDQITLGIETQVLVNWPKPCIAALPVSLSVSVVKFAGTLAIEFVPSPPDTLQPETYISFSILEDFQLAFEVHSLLGHRTKVKDLPKLTAMITSKLRNVFVEEIVWPRFKKVRVPMLWGDAREEMDVQGVREELEELVEELKNV
ncbi:ERMES complex subunit mmm1 [Rhizophlyctis rosea]|nr:ERMES complex subunit mmm1 [Rhizophlyctis rosea]